MSQLSEQSSANTTSRPIIAAERARGAVKRVDTVEREITVLLPTGLTVFDVPSDCRVLLRGEPIKLRLIQPRDRVEISFIDCQGRLTARMLEV
jgi:hypothetical protein